MCGAQMLSLQNRELTVICDPSIESAGRNVIRIYPQVKDELETLIGWQLDVKPRVVLVKNSRRFQQMTRHALYVAFAVPEKNLVVIDYSKMATRPFTLGTTLKHELCHLLLHHHIARANLPRWLDEGVCQWASDGLADIIMTRGGSLLRSAVLSDRLIPFSRLTAGFPSDNWSLMLAYAQSKSMVDYISREYGKAAVVDILTLLRNGETVESALKMRLSLASEQLEAQWRHHLKAGPTWLVYLANNIYAILFFLAGVITIAGFVRLVLRKRAYRDEDEEDEY